MPLFKVIETEADLPGVGGGAERLSFDLKERYRPPVKDSYEEIAKDVAAFANASGGVVLVGAVEDGATRALKNYSPLPGDEANELKDHIGNAVRTRCGPVPLVDTVVIPQAAGGYVVAINVRAFPGHPVAVLVGKPDGGPEKYRFPLRTVTGTTFIRPEQLPMLMVPEVRRIAILVDAIREGDQVDVVIPNPNNLRSTPVRIPFTFVGADAFSNVIRLKEEGHPQKPLVLPLDQTRTVWREGDAKWALAILGFIAPDHIAWHYCPALGV